MLKNSQKNILLIRFGSLNIWLFVLNKGIHCVANHYNEFLFTVLHNILNFLEVELYIQVLFHLFRLRFSLIFPIYLEFLFYQHFTPSGTLFLLFLVVQVCFYFAQKKNLITKKSIISPRWIVELGISLIPQWYNHRSFPRFLPISGFSP